MRSSTEKIGLPLEALGWEHPKLAAATPPKRLFYLIARNSSGCDCMSFPRLVYLDRNTLPQPNTAAGTAS